MKVRFSILDVCAVTCIMLVYAFAIVTLSRCGLLQASPFSLGALITGEIGLFAITYLYRKKVNELWPCWCEGAIVFRLAMALIEIAALSDALLRGRESILIPLVQSPVVEWLNAGTFVGILPTVVLRQQNVSVYMMGLRLGSLAICVIWFLRGLGKLVW